MDVCNSIVVGWWGGEVLRSRDFVTRGIAVGPTICSYQILTRKEKKKKGRD
jgi:hypothetical protein